MKENGYATSWFGKDHNTPFYQASQAGPFDQWPNGMGFDYFYGRRRRRQPVATEPVPQYDGHLSLPGQSRLEPDDRDGRRGHPAHQTAEGDRPDKPFFVYYVPAAHSAHHPTPEWVKKISDMHLFDDGWNKLRETIFANQKRLGIMPRMPS